MKIVSISDTHNKHDSISIPDGDVLVHCGDFSLGGSIGELFKFNEWLGTLPHKYKLVIPGNHDFIVEDLPELCRQEFSHATLLIDELVEIEGKKFYGTPWVSEYGRWAFMLPERDLKDKFSNIPEDLDILITHGPPKKILDRTRSGVYAGSLALFNRCKVVKPRISFFGHIHEGYGKMEFVYEPENWVIGDKPKGKVTTFYNVSSCDAGYKPVNKAVEIEIF